MNENDHRTTTGLLAAYAQKHLKRFEKSLIAARESGEVEAVHDVRVASRRLAEPLRLMGSWLGKKSIRRERRLFRKTRRALRKVRDIDVLQRALMESSAGVFLEPTDLAQAEGVLTRRREKKLSIARRRWAEFDADRLAARANRLADRFANAVQEGLDESLARQVESLFRKRVERLLARDPRQPESVDLHQTRICVKRLRYATELMRDTRVRADQELIDVLSKMQEHLGHWNDDLVAARMIAEVACRKDLLVEQPAWSARLLAYAAERARSAEAGRRLIVEQWSSVDAVLRRFVERFEQHPSEVATAVETPS